MKCLIPFIIPNGCSVLYSFKISISVAAFSVEMQMNCTKRLCNCLKNCKIIDTSILIVFEKVIT